MEKLVKLLNEYHFSGTEYIGYFLDEKENRIYFRTKVVDKGLVDEQRISDERIISKKFGFIKWLVEKDKIDFNKALEDNGTFRYTFHKLTRIKNYEKLIMYLSIRDEPIDFLISILK